MAAQGPQDSEAIEEQAPPVVGIVGGGQLGRMLVAAASPLGITLKIFQTDSTGPMDGASQVTTARWSDREAVASFAQGCDVITLEHEWADLEGLRAGAGEQPALWPSAKTMAWVGDKLVQKRHAKEQGLPLGPFEEADSVQAVKDYAERYGYPLMLKRPTHSYDGFGNARVDGPEDVEAGFAKVLDHGRVLVEAWVPYRRELAVMVARRPDGVAVAYPVAETVQENNQCVSVEVPAPGEPAVIEAARALALRAAEVYECVGVVGVEMFETETGEVLLNEIAPRPHNSGHYTIDACVTSQFENHLRAVLGWPLGDTRLLGEAAVMVNVVGSRKGQASFHAMADALSVEGACVHIYGKREVRPNRKMGHVTAVGQDMEDARQRANEAARRLVL